MLYVYGQVALLFLTAGVLFHERSWALWFSQAAELLPLDSLLLDASVSSGAATWDAACGEMSEVHVPRSYMGVEAALHVSIYSACTGEQGRYIALDAFTQMSFCHLRA